jgi:hypothetical protein
MARQVIPLWVVANIFQDPPRPESVSSPVAGTLRLDAGHHTTSSVLQKLPLWPLQVDSLLSRQACCLVMACNNGYSSASVLKSSPNGGSLPTASTVAC